MKIEEKVWVSFSTLMEITTMANSSTTRKRELAVSIANQMVI